MKKDKTGIWRGALPMAVVALALSLALGSCSKEPLQQGQQLDKEYLDFSLELTPPGAFTPVQSRAMTDVQQNAINSAEVLVFHNNRLLYHKMGTVADIDGVKKRVQVKLKTSQSTSDLFDIMVIGNPPASFDFAPYVSKTKGELKSAFSVSAAGKWSGSEFVMYGEALQTPIKPTTNNFKIQMLRTMARVDIGVGAYDEATDSWAGLGATFSLKEVRVVNSRDKFAAIPSSTVLSPTGNVMVSAPTIPSGTTVQGPTAATAIEYSGSDITIVDGNGRHTQSAIFLAEAPNATDRVTLLVGGSYNGGATTYYRVDMCIPRAGAPGSYDYLNILRNHLYRINITSISGDGFSDPQEALISAPINITTELIPIEEGGMGGDIIFDGNNYIMSDIAGVQIYGKPDGVKTYTIATVKANFVAGVAATVTGPGISGAINLANGVSQTITAAIPAGTTTENYTIKVGKLTKLIPLTVQAPIDAHFDFLPFQNVARIIITDPQPWLTLSNNKSYVLSEQQSTSITGNAQGKAVVHFNENIATSGNPRMAHALVLRNNKPETTRVYLEQQNLSGMVLGIFGGAKNNNGYTKQLAIESVEEYAERIYDDTSIGRVTTGIEWGFGSKSTGVTSVELGRAGTITLANRTDSGITAPYSIYNNYAARYCYDKNRDTNGNGTIEDNELLWYLPAIDQLKGLYVACNEIPNLSGHYYSTTEVNMEASWSVDLFNGWVIYTIARDIAYKVRCVRDIMP